MSGLAHINAADQLVLEMNKILDLNENYREKRRTKEDVIR